MLHLADADSRAAASTTKGRTMPFVLVNNVRLEDPDKAQEALRRDVIPAVKQAPGLIRGTWCADIEQRRGISMVVFETREQAEGALQRLRSGEMPIPDGVTFEQQAIYEVVGEA
jgi:hypothetical protein